MPPARRRPAPGRGFQRAPPPGPSRLDRSGRRFRSRSPDRAGSASARGDHFDPRRTRPAGRTRPVLQGRPVAEPMPTRRSASALSGPGVLFSALPSSRALFRISRSPDLRKFGDRDGMASAPVTGRRRPAPIFSRRRGVGVALPVGPPRRSTTRFARPPLRSGPGADLAHHRDRPDWVRTAPRRACRPLSAAHPAVSGKARWFSLFAHCVALTRFAVGIPRDAKPKALAMADALAQVLGLDMTAYWLPTARSYFERVTKAQILAAVRQIAPTSRGRSAAPVCSGRGIRPPRRWPDCPLC